MSKICNFILFAAYVQTVTNVKDAIVTRLTMKDTCKTERKKNL